MQQQTTRAITTATETVAAGQQRPRAPTTPARIAPSRRGLFCLVCIVLVLVAVRFALWTMMAELCFSVDGCILFSAIQQQTPQGNTTATGTVAAGQQRPRAPTTPARTAPNR